MIRHAQQGDGRVEEMCERAVVVSLSWLQVKARTVQNQEQDQNLDQRSGSTKGYGGGCLPSSPSGHRCRRAAGRSQR